MPDPSPLTAFEEEAPKRLVVAPLTITEDRSRLLVSLAIPRAAKPGAIDGLALPGPGHWSEAGDLGAVWIAPDHWLIEGTGDDARGLAAKVRDQAPGCAVTDQTDGWIAFDIVSSAGETPIVALMEKLVNIDPARLAPGCGLRTLLHHMTVVVIRRRVDCLTVLGGRSFAGSIWHALSETATRQTDARQT